MKYKVITDTKPINENVLGEMFFHGWDLITIIPTENEDGITEFIHYFKEVKHNYNGGK